MRDRCARIASRHLLLNVKRLHPLAGQRFLIEAMREVVREFPIRGWSSAAPARCLRAAGSGTIGRRRAACDVRRSGRQRAGRALLRRRGPLRAAVAPRSAADCGGRSARLRYAGRLADNPGGLELSDSSAPMSRLCLANRSIRWLRPSRTGSGTSDGRCRPRATSSRGSSVRPRSLTLLVGLRGCDATGQRRPSTLAATVRKGTGDSQRPATKEATIDA